MSDITGRLPEARLKELRNQFHAEDADKELAKLLPLAFPASQEYIDAIANTFAVDLPDDLASGPRQRLSRPDRERVLIALLASRNERLNLAIHIYVALGLEIAPHEILHILLLAGVYTGLPTFASALDVVDDTFRFLAGLGASELSPEKVIERMRAAFDLPPPNA